MKDFIGSKKLLNIAFFVLVVSFFAVNFTFCQAAGEKLEVDFFYGSVCPNCAAEEKFLDKIEERYAGVKINRYLISNPENKDILKKLCSECDAEKYIGLVPLTFVNHEFFLGFDNGEGIGRRIENSIRKNLGYPALPGENGKITVPLLGEINIGKYSLLTLTVILGFLDGFNVCSLGALVFILGLVLAFRSREKVLVFGGIFILTTAVIYGLLMVLWYQFFSLLSSYIGAMQVVVGLIAIGGGIYFFKEFLKFRKQGPVCEMGVSQGIAAKFTSRMQKSFKNSKNIFAVIGSLLVFAALITVIEFPCSAAVPVVYAGILTQAELAPFQYIFYIALFVFLYMADEIIIFLVSIATMKLWLASKKFVTYITLIEAIVLFLLGVYYLSGFF